LLYIYIYIQTWLDDHGAVYTVTAV